MSESSNADGLLASLAQPKPAVGKRLRVLLYIVFGLFALLSVNAVYLTAVRVLEWQTGRTYQNLFYLQMFLVHLIVGLVAIVPTVMFLGLHLRNALGHRNRRAVKAGLALLVAVLVLIISGVVLMRVEGMIEVNHPTIRAIAFWLHILAPLFVIWLYVLHRLAGKRINWRMGLAWIVGTAAVAGAMILFQIRDPRAWNIVGTEASAELFYPARSRSATGVRIASKVLRNDKYCMECHRDVHDGWAHSAHRFSSFNNPAYVTSVRETRADMIKRDGDVKGARFCAGCHDPVPLFSGEFDTAKYDDPSYDIANDFEGGAGITCTVCHAISHVNSRLGNGDYTLDEPIHYPFAFSENESLQWVNQQLIKAKPRFHKQTFLKPLHKSTEFCGSCHKVHLPEELNDYRWLRGQNHFDSFWLSGVSGHSVASFYYPKVAEANCNKCHMPLVEVDHTPDHQNFSARLRPEYRGLTTMHHLFPSANTAMPHLLGDQFEKADDTIRQHAEFLKECMRVDLFALRKEGRIDGELLPINSENFPELQPGKTYLLEVVLRTLTLGHHFTQGTVDSNQVWLQVETQSDGDGSPTVRSGATNELGAVDPWSYFLNAFVIDRDGNRINRRNAEDIFVALYNHQIPPGAAEVVHYRFTVPEDATGSLRLTVRLNYRKFDTEYMRIVLERDDSYVNDLPIVDMCSAHVELPIAGGSAEPSETTIPEWQRWNDYGIGLLRQGQLRQAEEAFGRVEQLGFPTGALNRARVYLAEGRVQEEAPAALVRAREMQANAVSDLGGAPEWSLLWFSGLVNKQNAEIDAAIDCFDQIIAGGFAEASGRGFDFSQDYRLLIEAAETHYMRGLKERGVARADRRSEWMEKSKRLYLRALELDPENASAHYGIRRVYEELEDAENAAKHDALHAKYKADDNARDMAIAAARKKYPAANHAAEDVVIYDLDVHGDTPK